MEWLIWLNWAGYSLGVLGIVLLIWSLLKQGVSIAGIGLLTLGFVLVILADFIVYFSHSAPY